MLKAAAHKRYRATGALCLKFPLLCALLCLVQPAKAVVSDDFSSGSLNTTLWTFVNPVGDGSYEVNTKTLRISVPAGSDHNVWTGGNKAPRVMQTIANTDFTVEAKFQSQVSLKSQMQGFIIEQDANNYVRFDVYSDGSSVRVFGATIVNGKASSKFNQVIGPGSEYYLRVGRQGSLWMVSYSHNGTTWASGGSFTQALTVSKAGVFAGNATGSSSPAFTAVVDYVFNTASPIVPEDGEASNPTPPTISEIGDQTIGMGGTTGAIPFTVGDAETPAGSLTLSGGSSNPSLVPNGNIVFGGSGANRTVTVNAASGQTGNATITVTVSDGELTESETFLLTVNSAGNTPPTISAIGDQTIGLGGTTGAIAFTVGDAETAAANLTVTGSSSNQALVPDGNIAFGGSGANRTVTVNSVGGQTGSTTITVTVSDGELTSPESFVVAVTSSGPFVSDDFSSGNLNTGLWTFVNPVGDGTFEVVNKTLRISVPAGSDHNVWTGGNKAPRVMQTIANTDFTVEAKFQSQVSLKSQMQGFIIEQDANNYLRFDVYSDGSKARAFSASVSAGTASTRFNNIIATGTTYYLRVERLGHQWTFFYSLDGNSWIAAGTYSHTLAVTQAGVFAGNATGSSSPAFTAVVDYVFNTASPIIPEDAEPPPSPPGPFVSDDFSDGSLNTGWVFVNPVGDGSLQIIDKKLHIHVPGGVDHNVWTGGNKAPRIMRVVTNSDFQVEAKFQSAVAAKTQMQGFIIEQDPNNYLRFDVFWDGFAAKVFSATIASGIGSSRFSNVITTAEAYYLRVERLGSQWTFSYSYDGSTWTIAGTYTHTLTVSQIGVFSGNATGSTSPAFTAVVDYVFNTASPIVPEDDGDGSVVIKVSGSGVVAKNPDLTLYPGGQSVELTAIPNPGWAFSGWSGDATGNSNPLYLTIAGDQTVKADFVPTDPTLAFDIWFGDNQKVGSPGRPQPLVNVLGNITIPDQITSLEYELNGTSQGNLTFGPHSNIRLARPGDFNAEIPFASLAPGVNMVEFIATHASGQQFSKTIFLYYYFGSVWPQPYSIDWNTVTYLQDVAQAVDGKWAVESGGVRSVEPHYDRLLAMGEVSWTDYEVTVPITVESIDFVDPNNPPCVGVLLRWDGHEKVGSQQPGTIWFPVGAMGVFRWYNDALGPRFQIYEGYGTRSVDDTSGRRLEFGTRYIFKMRVETVAGQPAGYYSFKVWVDGQPEPANWDLVDQAVSGLLNGSILLVSHYADATFGNVTIVPLTSP